MTRRGEVGSEDVEHLLHLGTTTPPDPGSDSLLNEDKVWLESRQKRIQLVPETFLNLDEVLIEHLDDSFRKLTKLIDEDPLSEERLHATFRNAHSACHQDHAVFGNEDFRHHEWPLRRYSDGVANTPSPLLG